MEKSPYFNIAKEAFEKVVQSLPHLTTQTEYNVKNWEIVTTIPKQTGLIFEVRLCFEGDELYFAANNFWCERFSVSDPNVVSEYIQDVLKIISGEYRIVEQSINGKVVKAQLQMLVGDDWKTTYSGSQLHFPFFRKKSIEVIQNILAP